MSIVDKMLKWWDSGLQALVPPTKTWEPPHPPRKYKEPILKTWDVTLKDGDVSEVTADTVRTDTDHIMGETVVQFWNGSTVVAEWPEIEIVTYEEVTS